MNQLKTILVLIAVLALCIAGPLLWTHAPDARFTWNSGATDRELAECWDQTTGEAGVTTLDELEFLKRSAREAMDEAPECRHLSSQQRRVLRDLFAGMVDQYYQGAS